MKLLLGFRKLEIWFLGMITVLTLAGIFLFPRFTSMLEWFFRTHEPKQLAERGEAYIIWHSFFDMLAWTFVALALVLQLRDARQRDSQFAEQLRAQQFQSIFFPYMTLFQRYIEEHVHCGPLHGLPAIS